MNKLFENWNRYLKEDEQQSLPMDISPARSPEEVAELKFNTFLEKHGADLKPDFGPALTRDDMGGIFGDYFLRTAGHITGHGDKDEAHRKLIQTIDHEINDFYYYMEKGRTTFDKGLRFLFMRVLEEYDKLNWDKTKTIPTEN
tara:strand:+ start:109 stop:537 length:429 start_codon:yes stop_codon:yes gene_type:complete